MSDTRCEKHKGYSVTVCPACLQARVAKLEKCRNDLYKRAEAAEAKLDAVRGLADCADELMEKLGD